MRITARTSSSRRGSLRVLAAATLAALLAWPGSRPIAQQQAPDIPTFTTTTGVNLVSVDVVIRDASGNILRGLTAKDFQVLEDGRPQQITTFSFQEIEDTAPAPETVTDATLLAGLEDKLRFEAQRAASATTNAPPAEVPEAVIDLNGRRLVVLLFDVSSMQPEDVQRAVESGMEYVNDSMSSADMVAVVTIGSRLNVLTDFTSSREDIMAALQALAYSDGTDIDITALTTAATDEAAAGGETTAEADAFEEFNNDVRLRAIKTLSDMLAPVQQRKAVIYFSAGMRRSGNDNQIELRAAINAANRANINIYYADARGLQALVAGGDASRGSGRGTALFTGQGATQQFQQLNASQDTLATLAADTGGRAFTDSNNFGSVFSRVQSDLSAYYLLGYSSTNPADDGRFRRITVRLASNVRNARIESARPGYYANRSFANTNRRDREAQLDDQLAAAVSSTDVPLVLGAGWFRQSGDRFYVPIALAVPGSSVPVATGSSRVTLDVRGLVRDEQGRTVGRIRETLEVQAPPDAETLAGRQVMYQSGVTLPPGQFSVKVVVRENTGGAIGSFEAPLIVPQLPAAAMKVSSVVMSTQVQQAPRGRTDNPLVRDGTQLLPNLTRVVGRNQSVYFYYEVYDPALIEQTPHLRTSMAFYRGGVKVFETPLVERTVVDDPSRRAVVFQFEVPASQFTPGNYTCQINIIDTVAGQVSFPRMSFAVMN